MKAVFFSLVILVLITGYEAGYIVNSNVLYQVNEGGEETTTSVPRNIINIRHNCATNEVYVTEVNMCLVKNK